MVGLVNGYVQQNNFTQPSFQSNAAARQDKDIDEQKPKNNTPQPAGTASAESQNTDTRNDRSGREVVASANGLNGFEEQINNQARGSIVDISV